MNLPKPPTYKFLPIPTPPATINAPELVPVESVVLYVLIISSVVTNVVVTVVSCIVNFSATISPATYTLPPIPTPPFTTSAPVVVDTLAAVSYIVTCVFVENITSPVPFGSINKSAFVP